MKDKPVNLRACFTGRCIRLVAMAALFGAAAAGQFIYTPFDAPGASTVGLGTLPGAINNNGDIAGVVADSSGNISGFIRSASGVFTVFALPEACNESNCGARINGLNDLGQLVGYVGDSSGSILNFLRDQNGNYTSLPGPPDGSPWMVTGLTNGGESLATVYTPSSITGVGYLLSAAGVFTVLPLPAGLMQPYFVAINNDGEFAGGGIIERTSRNLAFGLNVASGEFTYFGYDLPLQNGSSDFGTSAWALNDGGQLIGQSDVNTSFIRSADGSEGLFFQPALPDTGSNQPGGINLTGIIAGVFPESTAPGYQGRGYIGVPSSAGGTSSGAAPPSISLMSLVQGPPAQAVFPVVDPVSGLVDVQTQESNAELTVSTFANAQTTPVTVTATKIDQSQVTDITMTAANTVGLTTTSGPALVTVYGDGGPVAGTLSGIPASEHVLTVTNGDPGLAKLTAEINGKKVVIPLVSGDTWTANLEPWMTLPSNNVRFAGDGPGALWPLWS
jgi:hypothetical protein